MNGPDPKILSELITSVTAFADLISRHQSVPDRIRSQVDQYIELRQDPQYREFWQAMEAAE